MSVTPYSAKGTNQTTTRKHTDETQFTVGSFNNEESFLRYMPERTFNNQERRLAGRVTKEQQRPKSTQPIAQGGGSKAPRERAATTFELSTHTGDSPSYEGVFKDLKFFFDKKEFIIKPVNFSDDLINKLSELEQFARRILDYEYILNLTALSPEDLLYLDEEKDWENQKTLKRAAGRAEELIFDPIGELEESEFEALINKSKQASNLYEVIKKAPDALRALVNASTFTFEGDDLPRTDEEKEMMQAVRSNITPIAFQ